MYSDYGKEFNRKGLSSFGNGFARNVVSFGVDKSSSSHADNCKKKIFVLREDQLIMLMAVLVQQRRSLVLILVEQKRKFA